MIGRTLSHYRIEALLGAGGMGVVYRARDLHLERDVALKVLPGDALADDVASKRFRREALALSKLNHPHIATVHDFDTQDGVDFLVMELVAGVSLAERLRGSALMESDVIALGIQIAGALEAAHEQGVVHRDLKPANVVLTAKGEAKVLDFGLARLLRPAAGTDLTKSLTEANVTVGTLPYMAPEQLLGRNVDARADLFSLGVILYEAATGRSPYLEKIPTALVYEVVNQPPPQPRKVAPNLSPHLEKVILRCLEKDPNQRYACARELAADLKGEAVPQARLGRAWARGPVRVGVVLAVLTVAVLALAFDFRGMREGLIPGASAARIRALAVLPLENLSRDPDQEFFADGMTDELITRLAQVAALRVISRASTMQYKGTKKQLRQIARELHVDAVVTGSVLRSGDRTRISAQLIRATTDENLWADSYEGDVRDVLALQSRVARSIAERIRVSLTPRERAGLASARQVDPRVTEAYLKARFFLNRFEPDDWERAQKQFNLALELDPTYAPAYAGLSEAYATLSNFTISPREAMPKAKVAASRALELDPSLAEAQDALTYVRAFYEWNWHEAGLEFQQAIELNPGRSSVHRNYAQYLMALGRFDEASAEIRKAIEIDPLSSYLSVMTLWPLFEGRQYGQAVAAAEKLLREDSTLTYARFVLGQALLEQGDAPRAVTALRVATRGEVPLLRAWLARAFVAAGQRDSAQAIIEEIKRNTNHTYVSPYAWVLIHAALGDKEKSFEWLYRCIEDRTDELSFVQSDPGLDALRSDPRFADVLRKVGFSTEAD